MKKNGEMPQWGEWCRAYVPESNNKYAYKTAKDSDNVFDARRRVLVAQQWGGTWRGTAKGNQSYGTHVTDVPGELPMFRIFRRTNGNIATYKGLAHDGDGNMMPIHPDAILEWFDKLKGGALACKHTSTYSKSEAADVLAAYGANLNKMRGGIGTPEEKNQRWRDGLELFFDELCTPDNMDELGRPYILKCEYDGVANHGWSLDDGRSPEYNEQTATEGVENGMLDFETYLDRKLYDTPLRPSIMYMASDMLTEAWIDNGKRDCVPKQRAQVMATARRCLRTENQRSSAYPHIPLRASKRSWQSMLS